MKKYFAEITIYSNKKFEINRIIEAENYQQCEDFIISFFSHFYGVNKRYDFIDDDQYSFDNMEFWLEIEKITDISESKAAHSNIKVIPPKGKYNNSDTRILLSDIPLLAQFETTKRIKQFIKRKRLNFNDEFIFWIQKNAPDIPYRRQIEKISVFTWDILNKK